MGAKFFKNTFTTQNRENVSKSSIPLEKEKLEILSTHQNLDTEFNKLYLNSREKLHAITTNPSDEIMKNIKQYLNQNSKFLNKFFNEIDLYLYDLVDEVTERLTYENDDYKIPKTDAKNVGSYLGSKSNYDYEKQP